MKSCNFNISCIQGFVYNKNSITIGYGNKNGDWTFAECMDYVKKFSENII